MRVVVVGAGSVGAAIGARLFQAGTDVVLVARGAHLDALRADGLRFATPGGTEVLRIPTVAGPAELALTPEDVLLLTTKSQDTAAALATWADAPVGERSAREVLPIVCAQNGMANERLALRRFADVYAACVWLPATLVEPGSVVAESAPLTGILHLGRYPGGSDETARRIAATLNAAGIGAPVRDDVMRWKRGKLLRNLGNATDALFAPSEQRDEVDARAAQEGRSVLDAAGLSSTSPEEEQVERAGRILVHDVPGHERGGGSSFQSLARGLRSIETDHLNGEIVLEGRLHGVPAPVNAALCVLAARAVREHRPPRSGDAGELAALLALAGGDTAAHQSV